ncbi:MULTISPECIES: SDR family NAD(P)-dependent oxidoreductase [Methylobacterium]|uniref:SDR family NAD(P)-dependent oxidoreductase n=1 Tax=Methylobacterium TaxID=407 RepID=UPI0013ED9298|nr:SDR family oxidoreductase [Methylobacterium sp. DB0501]NGM34122.1 SDR family oxidoreductase [Methylobacterium sp. DB0501]
MPWLELEGRTAIVTGAGGGIGRASARALGAAGCRIACLDRAEPEAEMTALQIREAGGTAVMVPCDVANPESVANAAATTAAAFGPADVLVNNAGLLRPGPLADLPLHEWNALLAVNLTGYFLCAQVFGRQMRERGGGGSLIHVASIAADHATPFGGAYSVAKAGVTMLSRQLAIEWAEDRIRSNVVHPGMIRTPLSQAFYEEPGATGRRVAVIPSRRIGEPQDIADAVLFLASPRSSYVNGDAITVDGGYVRNVMSLIPRAGYEPAPGPRA